METLLLIIIVLVIILIAAVVYLISKQNSTKPQDFSKDIESKLNEMFPTVLKNANAQLVSTLTSEKKEISSDLSNKKEAIERLVSQIKEDLNKQSNKLEMAEKERIGSFMALKQEMETHKELTKQLSATTEGLKNVLSNNQLRGQFGEQIAEDLLRMVGFVKGTDYIFNKEQSGSETRPDFTVFLPDGTRINVDAKFPYNNLKKYIETEDKSTQVELLKAFSSDIKAKIKQVSNRNYINPEDKTVDFVILFIPNEMIFSFIYDKLGDIWLEAMKNKVVLAGPFSFTAILRMVRQAQTNFRYQKNIYKNIEYIKTFEIEFQKFSTEFEKVGDKIDSLSKQYNEVNTTRTNKLIKVIEKINIAEVESIEGRENPLTLGD